MAETADQRCPTCRTTVPEGASRCPACGRVFGEENRCPHCNAIAAVIQKGGKTVCAACRKPRGGSAVLAPSGVEKLAGGAAGKAGRSPALTRARGRGQRAFGITSLAGGVLAAVLAAMILPGGWGIAMALIMGLIGVGVGGLSLRAGAKSMTRASQLEREGRERAILELAEKEGGQLTATRVAKELDLSVEDADAALTAMIRDGTRVNVDVDDEGVLHYVFRELRPRPGARVRVETEEDEPVEDPAAATERAKQREAPGGG